MTNLEIVQRMYAAFGERDRDTIMRLFHPHIEWVQNDAQYTEAAKVEFANVADGWVVAYAKENALIVVTEEVHNRDIKRKVPIPNLCIRFDVEYMNTINMLRELGIRFVLGKRGS